MHANVARTVAGSSSKSPWWRAPEAVGLPGVASLGAFTQSTFALLPPKSFANVGSAAIQCSMPSSGSPCISVSGMRGTASKACDTR